MEDAEAVKTALLKNPFVKNLLSALAVSFFSFVLWNVAFVLYALFFQIVHIFTPIDMARSSLWLTPYILIVFTLMVAVLSWFVFQSSLPDLVKATCATAPLVIVLVSIGILTYPNPWLAYALSTVVVALALTYLRLSKKPWIYYYAALFTAITLLIFNLAGGEI